MQTLRQSYYNKGKGSENFFWTTSAEDALKNEVFLQKKNEIGYHLGNVRAVISDLKESTITAGVPGDFEPDIIATNSYYAFGMLQPNRHFGTENYEYGFNGKRMDSEISGTGNSYDYGFRIYNPRIGRFLSVDPLTEAYPWYTPYQYAGNKPIAAIDIDGLEEYFVVNWLNKSGEIIRSKLKVVKDSKKNVVNRNSTINGINRSKSTVHTRTVDADGNLSDNFSNNKAQVNQIMDVDKNPRIVSVDQSIMGNGYTTNGGTQEYYQTVTTYSGGGKKYGSEQIEDLGSRFFPSGNIRKGEFIASNGDAWISRVKQRIEEFKTSSSNIKITGILFTLDKSTSFGAEKSKTTRSLLKTSFPDAKTVNGSVGKLDFNLSVTFKKGVSTPKTSSTVEDPAGN